LRASIAAAYLNVLGVIIGTAVIAVGSIITAGFLISNIFRSFGPSTLIVFKFQIGFRFDVSREEFMRKPLTLENATRIGEALPLVKFDVSPYLFPDWNKIHNGKY